MGKKANKLGGKSAAERSVEDLPRTGVGKGGRGKGSRSATAGNADASGRREPCGKCGQVHRKCNGHTRNGPNAGKPCGANPPAFQVLCIKHGGNNPSHRAKARERLEAMVVPFIEELRRIVLDPETDATVKVRGIQILLDRTGYGPGAKIEVGMTTPFDAMLVEAFDPANFKVDRSSLGPRKQPRELDAGGGANPLGTEDVEQHGLDAQTEAWRDFDNEDARDYERGRIRPDENTVRGEVLSILPEPPERRMPTEFGGDPTRPPRYDPASDA